MIKYLVFAVFVLAAVSAKHLESPPNPNAKCNDGDTTSFNNCNNCLCSGGNWTCAFKLCLNSDQKVKRSVYAPCKDGDVTSFDNGCNNCTCGNGNWACTMKFCLDSISNAGERTKRALAKECTPNQTKKEDCNRCFCTSTGIWACTKLGCNRKREAIAAGSTEKISN